MISLYESEMQQSQGMTEPLKMHEHVEILDLLNDIVVHLKLLEVPKAPKMIDTQNICS
jgi:hypothetical protein